MKVLLTPPAQLDKKANDFSWTESGEILTFGHVCDGAGKDHSCGCDVSFIGIDSKKATTTAVVTELPEEVLRKRAQESSYCESWSQADPGFFDDLWEDFKQIDGMLQEAKLGDIVRVKLTQQTATILFS